MPHTTTRERLRNLTGVLWMCAQVTSRRLHKHCFHLIVKVHEGRSPLQLISGPGHLWAKQNTESAHMKHVFDRSYADITHYWAYIHPGSPTDNPGVWKWTEICKHANVRKNCCSLIQPFSVDKYTESQEVRWPTSRSVHDPLDVKEERSEPHLHQQLVAMIQADAKGKVALQHSLLRTLWRPEHVSPWHHCETTGKSWIRKGLK